MTFRRRNSGLALCEDIAAGFAVRHVMTPMEEAVCISASDMVGCAVERLSASHLDYAPVTSQKTVTGIFRSDGRGDEPGQAVADVLECLTPHNTVDGDAPLEELPKRLLDCPFHIVMARKKAVGLVTVADLNKNPMRILLFLHIADAERWLAELIKREYPGNDDWMKLLSPVSRTQIKKVFDQERRGDVDVGLLQCTYLKDLLTVIRESAILARMSPLIDWNLSKKCMGINELRNSAVHPNRPLLRTASDLPKLVDRVQRLHDIMSAADELLNERSHQD